MKRFLVPVAGLLLVLAGASTAAAAPVEPDGPAVATQGKTGSSSISIQHANYCNNFVNYGTSWRADCNVDYGRSGAWTQCSDGTEIWGPLVGPGYWIFGGSCSGHGSVRDWGVYDG
ncbi:hypothetical protein ACFYXP_28905 [Streptomyces sp. NPDC002466]|uniref:hypothetical protein n=1 Tax=unclassified Streptomyces TaxID=2593676 RepID=UPI0021CC7435|nr:hypothetical protein [Streptomyces sp. sk2.1]